MHYVRVDINMTDALVQLLYPSCQAILGLASLHRRNILSSRSQVELRGRKLEIEGEKSETMENTKQSLYVSSYKMHSNTKVYAVLPCERAP